MYNFYNILKINFDANLETILNAYYLSCIEKPTNIFIYTKALKILSNSTLRILYDASILKENFTIKYQEYESYELKQEIDEYKLAFYIEWLENFKNYFYDTKYFYKSKQYTEKIEKWYNELDQIIETLKPLIKSFYLC